MERTLIILKPDTVQRKLIGRIIQRFEDKGFKIVGMKMIWITKELAYKHYEAHINKPFFNSLLEFITSLPVVVMVLEGPEVVEQVRKMVGNTDCKKAEVGTIRFDFGLSIQNNLIHASESVQDAQREIKIFFRDDELFSYNEYKPLSTV
ncbi:MAG: nucleoside-diphosphate kinase [Candidatus Calescibacterium sp.]|nr:nucleoside-diphosphate kinase [Candidatus Calescibacterium sp.]MCS7244332.1 nucleoside-diphosphate kinase [Candidatus Calescibacterium sp.]MDW8133254.1 nucleoside-diphosphate kinase [Candidatus Calescibacterium sp.]